MREDYKIHCMQEIHLTDLWVRNCSERTPDSLGESSLSSGYLLHSSCTLFSLQKKKKKKRIIEKRNS